MTGKEPKETSGEPLKASAESQIAKRLGGGAVSGVGRIDYVDFSSPLNAGFEVNVQPSDGVNFLLDYAKEALNLGAHEIEMMRELYLADEIRQRVNHIASYADKKLSLAPEHKWLIDQAERGVLPPFEMLEVHALGIPNVTVAQYNYLPDLNEDQLQAKRAEIAQAAFMHGATSFDMDNFEIGLARYEHPYKDDFALNDAAVFKMRRTKLKLKNSLIKKNHNQIPSLKTLIPSFLVSISFFKTKSLQKLNTFNYRTVNCR